MLGTLPQDVLDRWIGPGQPAPDSPTLLTLIADAEDAVTAYYPSIAERILSGELPAARVKRVVAGVVIRAYKVGQDFRTSFSRSSGPFSEAGSFGAETPRGIALTQEDIDALAPSTRGGAFTIDTAPHAGAPLSNIWLAYRAE